MTDTPWHLEGKWLEYCSCDAGCPCESMAEPTQGYCEGAMAMQVDEGYYGDVRLDGGLIAATFTFPRAIHHGGGQMHPILPEGLSEDQVNAIFAILSGEGQPVGTIFNIFSVIIETIHEPTFAPIEFDWDIKNRRAKLTVPNLLRASTEPIRNPVTDEPVQVRTVLPDGWTFYEAEVGTGDVKSIGSIKVDFSHRHSSLAYFAFNNDGMAYSYEEAKAKYGLDNAA
jgi:hypothetical protein